MRDGAEVQKLSSQLEFFLHGFIQRCRFGVDPSADISPYAAWKPEGLYLPGIVLAF